MDNLTEGIKTAFDSTRKIKELERQVKLSDTVSNKLKLADEYMSEGQNKPALDLYKSCLTGIYHDDPNVLTKAVEASYHIEDYESVVLFAKKLKGNEDFNKSFQKTYLAWSLSKLDKKSEANGVFQEMDNSYSNYPQRIEYVHFLNLHGHEEEAKNKIQELLDEIESMDRNGKRMKKDIYWTLKNIKSKTTA
ncbi:MAG: hypothetical protein JXR03_18005 [Cyclobacteriaceae bacterium]